METSTRGAYANHRPRSPRVHVPTGPLSATDPNSLAHSFNAMAINGMGLPGNPGTVPVGWMNSFVDNVYPAGFNPMHHNLAMLHGENPYAQMHGPGYPGGYFGIQQIPLAGMAPYTPGRRNISQPRAHRGQSEVPGLENRRGSYSTNESTPATPFWTGLPNRENAPRVASLDRSRYTTPSPQQLGMTSMHGDIVKPVTSGVSDAALDALLQQEPPVPKAVPAVFTPPGQMKSVDQSLENRIPGNRNVYIRGLHPTTDDDLLYQFAARFGAVETSKAIIDTTTGACKGYVLHSPSNDRLLTRDRFGFAKFYVVHDSEMCIRGFHRLGYEVGFARVRTIPGSRLQSCTH